MSDREQFAQAAHDKRANEQFAQNFWRKSNILVCFNFYIRFLILKNELVFLSKSLSLIFFLQKTSDLLRKQMSEFPVLNITPINAALV